MSAFTVEHNIEWHSLNIKLFYFNIFPHLSSHCRVTMTVLSISANSAVPGIFTVTIYVFKYETVSEQLSGFS
jgi:hypothetical protein